MSELHVRKSPLRENQESLARGAKMSDAYVNEARGWADYLIRREFRGPGDTVDAAMARCERKYHVARSVLWGLRYRPPKDMMVSLYMRLRSAYEDELGRLDQRIEEELRKAELLGTDATNSKAYRVAVAALGKQATRQAPRGGAR
ncbi:hypothetical protein EN742_00710 [Mesorhizobium sp. M4A.F.Ca.ET.020.02.1.1]|uniref:hypothetical protein n=1 Tax=Mesorhizobium sp. M4A.F.Ca.ET.020.02.1.1 TaxID=2496652 RepID=UPI000FD5B24F|nr:hypothetical protein [Mesorhizobium sp. M4A.F.Ca.ET.020.02.1.1]RVD44899.1 hypothetical protein EN742_00710 [Mesorhizobium sp. M4A.F.Ca.ET.020.02.1.1]